MHHCIARPVRGCAAKPGTRVDPSHLQPVRGTLGGSCVATCRSRHLRERGDPWTSSDWKRIPMMTPRPPRGHQANCLSIWASPSTSQLMHRRFRHIPQIERTGSNPILQSEEPGAGGWKNALTPPSSSAEHPRDAPEWSPTGVRVPMRIRDLLFKNLGASDGLADVSRPELDRLDADLKHQIDSHFRNTASQLLPADEQMRSAKPLIDQRAQVLAEIAARHARWMRHRGAAWILLFFFLMGALGLALGWLAP